MSEHHSIGPLQPGDPAPDVVLDAITREGRIAIADYRGRKPVLIGLFRGLHCPFCRRHLAAQAEIDRTLRDEGIESIAVVSTPIERARLYIRYHPMPDLLAASDPAHRSHRAFGLPSVELTERETDWPLKAGLDMAMMIRIDIPDESEPVNPVTDTDRLNAKDGYEMTAVDEQMAASDNLQLFGQFLLDRDGIIRWTFTEVPDGGRRAFGRPSARELIEAARQVAG